VEKDVGMRGVGLEGRKGMILWWLREWVEGVG